MEAIDIASTLSSDEENPLPEFLLVELTSLSELSFLATNTTNAGSPRIKFTCLSASQSYLVVGSSGGNVYLFARHHHQTTHNKQQRRKSVGSAPIRVIPCKEGEIVRIQISPNETKIAVASSSGIISIVDVNSSNNKSSALFSNVLHAGDRITCLTWSSDGSRLFAGDVSGKVSLSRISKTYFISPCDLILRLDGPVVQIDAFSSLLLVSTISRTYLHDLSRPATIQIGKKLRNGKYGACFFDESADFTGTAKNNDVTATSIFVARPGARLWQASLIGCVYNTHQFTTVQAPYCNVINDKSDIYFTRNEKARISFSKISVINHRYLLSVNGAQIVVLDPNTARIILCTSLDEEIIDYVISERDLFVLTRSLTLHKLTLLSYVKAVERLHLKSYNVQAAGLVKVYVKRTGTCPFKIDVLKEILAHLTKAQRPLVPEFTEILEKAASFVKDKNCSQKGAPPKIVKLPSGIHEIAKPQTASICDVDDFAGIFESHRKLSQLAANCRRLNQKYECPKMSNDVNNRSSTRIKALSRDDGQNFTLKTRNAMASSRSEESLHNILKNGADDDDVIRRKDKFSQSPLVDSCNHMINKRNNRMTLDEHDVTYDELPSVPSVVHRNRMSKNVRLTKTPKFSTTNDVNRTNHEENSGTNKYESNAMNMQIKESAIITDFNRCSQCYLHKSWLVFFRLCFVIKRLPLFECEFSDGCLPSMLEDWTVLIQIWHRSRKGVQKKCLEILCPDCTILLQKWKQDFHAMVEMCMYNTATRDDDVITTRDDVITITRGDDVTVATKSPYSPWEKLTVEELEAAFFVNNKEKTIRLKSDQSGSQPGCSNQLMNQSCSLYYNPVYESCAENSTRPINDSKFLYGNNYYWLSSIDDVTLDLLLFAAYKCLNPDQFERLLVQNSTIIDGHVTNDFYAAILTYLTKIQFLPDEIANLLCYDLFGEKIKLRPYI